MRATRETIANARRLRRNLSPPEARLWSRLRARKSGAPIFRRQHPVGRYVLDFYCAEARLAVEIDGMSHGLGDRPERDMSRDAWLKARGLTVMRIAAGETMRNADEAADAIVRMATEMIRASAPSTVLTRGPPPPLRGLGHSHIFDGSRLPSPLAGEGGRA
jgi:very-short-patch-repair endonuclease